MNLSHWTNMIRKKKKKPQTLPKPNVCAMCLGLDHKTHDTILITDLIPPNLKTKLADAKEKV